MGHKPHPNHKENSANGARPYRRQGLFRHQPTLGNERQDRKAAKAD